MLVDALIVIFAISALYRGRELGFVRQLFTTIGFFGGLFFGAWLQPHLINIAHTQGGRSFVAIFTTIGLAILGLILGEYVGLHAKHRVVTKHINRVDIGLGSVLNVITLLVSSWLLAAIIGAMPFPGLQTAIGRSHIINGLNSILPSAPTVIADFSRLIDPNGFPQVFIGSEPIPKSVNLPSLGDLQAAVEQDRISVVKVQGQGCGGIVDGSGFIVDKDMIATNAHVVAGIAQPYVQDVNGTHKATVVWFDPNLDFAVLRTSGLAGKPLALAPNRVPNGTPAAVLGYPGGGGFNDGAAAIIEKLTASGRNIYDKGNTIRDIYEVQADVIPGNSGGPLVAKDGSVIGVIFAESTSYKHVGYALTMPAVITAINQAKTHTQPVSTRACAE